MTTPCTEKENIINLKKDNEYMTNIIKEIKSDVKEMKDDIKLWFSNIDVKFDNLEKKYASKWVEKVFIFVWSVAWASIIWSFMYLILK